MRCRSQALHAGYRRVHPSHRSQPELSCVLQQSCVRAHQAGGIWSSDYRCHQGDRAGAGLCQGRMDQLTCSQPSPAMLFHFLPCDVMHCLSPPHATALIRDAAAGILPSRGCQFRNGQVQAGVEGPARGMYSGTAGGNINALLTTCACACMHTCMRACMPGRRLHCWHA
eukprot:355924-Chlamydomonas_euryale.AAC.4